MAIDTVYVWNNTSIMQDEVLCHRIGLLPIKVDPRQFSYPREQALLDFDYWHADLLIENPESPHELDTLIFDLRVRCDRRKDAVKGETDPRKMYYDSNVYSGMMEWKAQGKQVKKFASNKPGPCDPDVLLVKLRPGQVCSFGVLTRSQGMLTIVADDRHALFRQEGYWIVTCQVVARW